METGTKRKLSFNEASAKRVKFLEINSEDEGGELELKVNEDYAKRFEHNKQREELRKLEEKYGKRATLDADSQSETSSSEDESEDELGELADEKTDAEIAATLQAIRSRDPRIYQKDTMFYSAVSSDEVSPKQPAEKPMFLRDYHRKTLLESGGLGETENPDPLPYVLEQEALKKAIVDEIHKSDDENNANSSDGDDFLVRKEMQPKDLEVDPLPMLDPSSADQDPEGFLSNFFTSRAWVPADSELMQPFESDNEEDERRAEEFENVWNMRFEDPEVSNQSLVTHSREIVAKYSVRRDQGTGRKRAREKEKQKRIEEKEERRDERSRLKTLKIKEMTAKLEKIRDAAGFLGKSIKVEDWAEMLEGDWEDQKWNDEMNRRFGNEYYRNDDNELESSKDRAGDSKKPKWDDDIDITDLVPDFNEADIIDKFKLSDEEDEAETSSGARVRSKSDLRRDRRIIEALADQSVPLEMGVPDAPESQQSFKYRETSPNTFGLTAVDILAATDAQLNQFAGLKKLSAFRNEEWKKKDKKKLGKKARLRAWRRDTFGQDEGPSAEAIFATEADQGENVDGSQGLTKDEDAPSLQRRKHKRSSRK